MDEGRGEGMMEEGERGWRRERGDGGGRDGMEEGERNTGGREEARGWKNFVRYLLQKMI